MTTMRRTMAAACAVFMVLPGGVIAAPETAGKPAPGIEIYKSLPKEPVFVSAIRLEDPAGMFDSILQTAQSLADVEGEGDLAKEVAGLSAEIGFSVRDDLIALLGPDLAFVVDLPPLDMAMAAMTPAGGGGGPAVLLGSIGLAGRTPDGKKLGKSVAALFKHWGAEVEEMDGGMIAARFNEPEDGGGGAGQPSPTFEVFYAQKGGTFSLGFGKDWVLKTLEGWPKGERLVDGADFARILAHLDASPASLTYVNLPKIKMLIEGSQMLKGFLSMNAESVPLYNWLMGSDLFELGAGSTSVKMDGGTRTTGFGPDWLSGGTAMVGVVAAVAIPNLLNAMNRGKQKRTLADMRSIATAIESFEVDKDTYPGPTDGFVSVATIAKDLEPVYIDQLPRQDGWGHDLLYWSDGEHYRIVSPGKDGNLDREWLGPVEEVTTADDAMDIVYEDGRFVVHPPMEP